MLNYTIRERTTDNLDFELLADGDAITLVGTDHIEMHMIDVSKKTYRYSSDDDDPAITITDEAEGEVRFVPPDANVFLYRKSPYKLYFQIWDTSSEKYSIPEHDRFEIKVLKEF